VVGFALLCETGFTMNFNPRTLILIVLVAVQSLIVAGCANTGRGLKRDTERNLDKVEDAVDR
jgi:predicted small secreted protein